jgi:hypothetical protein
MNKADKVELTPALREEGRKRLEVLIKEGASLRESGRMQEAESAFEEAERGAQHLKLYGRWVNIKLHRYLIFFHNWRNNRNPEDLEEMHQLAYTANRLSEQYEINGQPRALALMRFGQWQQESGKLADAVVSFRRAVAELKTSGLSDEPEYFGILGSALLELSDKRKHDEGLDFLNTANDLVTKMVSEDRSLAKYETEWGFLIVRVGIWLRLANGYSITGDAKLSENYMRMAKTQADKLAAEGKPQRLLDWEIMRAKIDQRL